MFLRTFFVLAATALVGVSAVASPAVNIKDPAVVGTKETEFGTLTFYGRSADYAPSLQKRQNQSCDTPDVRCLADPSFAPNVQACQLLITALDVLPPFPIDRDTHAICAGLDNHQPCCVSWEKAGVGLRSTDLVPVAQSIFSRCVPGGERAGFASDVDLRNICTRQCLTNTPIPAACGLDKGPQPTTSTTTTSSTTSPTTSTATATQEK